MNVLDDGGSRIAKDIGKFLLDYTASLPRRQVILRFGYLASSRLTPAPRDTKTFCLTSYPIP
jgi:hypothetical protein